MTGTSLIFLFIYFYESPKFLYNKGRYVESRACLKKIARFNGVVYNDNFTFDIEEELSIIKSQNDIFNTPGALSDQEDSLIPSNQQSPAETEEGEST